jgi:integrase
VHTGGAAPWLQLAAPGSLVFGDMEGAHRDPEPWLPPVRLGHRAVRSGTGNPAARLCRPRHNHDLRHTHATLLLAAGEPVKVVSERLGHATAMITLNVYQAVIPGMQRRAAERFASLVKGTGA